VTKAEVRLYEFKGLDLHMCRSIFLIIVLLKIFLPSLELSVDRSTLEQVILY